MKFRYYLLLAALSYWLGSSLVGYDHHAKYNTSDGEGYYMYLPAFFIYGSFENYPTHTPAEYKFYPNTNKIATRFTYGVALMEAPFFFAAQISRKIQGLPTDDGYANDISVALLFAGCFYTALGLFFMDKILRRYFKNKKTVWLTLITLYFGTNLMFYAIREPTMSHAYTFCLTAALVFYLPKFYYYPPLAGTITPSVKITLLIGFLLGLITLIRPTNILFIPFALLFDAFSLEKIKKRLQWLLKNIKTLWLIPFVILLLAIPQMLYWHYLSGKWILNIYKEMHAQTFNWTTPQFYKILFHPCNGFLLYTPLMVFALVGIAWMTMKNELNGRLIVSVLLIIAYVFASWCMWWFGHAFGYRSFIDYYPLLGLGMAFYINELLKSKMLWFKYLNLVVFVFFIFVNFRLTIAPFYWQVEPDGSRMEDFYKALNWIFDVSKW